MSELTKEACEAAAVRCDFEAAHMTMFQSGSEEDTAYIRDYQLAARCCRIVGAGLEGFESGWILGKFKESELDAYLSGHAATTVAAQQRIAELEAERDAAVARAEQAEDILDEVQAEYERDKRDFDEAYAELKCPECGCAVISDAEASECGCDSLVCSRDTGQTLAEHYIAAIARAEQAEADCRMLAGEVRRCHSNCDELRPFPPAVREALERCNDE